MIAILRLPLHLIPQDAEWPILYGPLRGKRWVVGSARRAFWLGTYEAHFQRLMMKELKPGAVFYDIGANVGFYSLLASGLVQSGKVFAFEPLPRNVFYLKRHLELNAVRNVEVYELAISDHAGRASFDEGADCGSGHLGSGGLSVQTATLDGLIHEQRIAPPAFVKMDIEGGELSALRGAWSCLTKYRPTMFLATHGDEIHERCRQLLQAWGFSFQLVSTMPEGRADVLVKPVQNSGSCRA
jgi:FkbM family methyltransferase